MFPNPSAEFDTTNAWPRLPLPQYLHRPRLHLGDMTLGKDFALPREGAKLAIRANFFNVFNILNLHP